MNWDEAALVPQEIAINRIEKSLIINSNQVIFKWIYGPLDWLDFQKFSLTKGLDEHLF